jgi:hypothetical protein
MTSKETCADTSVQASRSVPRLSAGRWAAKTTPGKSSTSMSSASAGTARGQKSSDPKYLNAEEDGCTSRAIASLYL